MLEPAGHRPAENVEQLQEVLLAHLVEEAAAGLDADHRVVCTIGSRWERDHLLFRDYLRSHPATAQEYAAVKRRAAAAHPTDRIAYTDAKDPWIRATVTAAEEWARATEWRP